MYLFLKDFVFLLKCNEWFAWKQIVHLPAYCAWISMKYKWGRYQPGSGVMLSHGGGKSRTSQLLGQGEWEGRKEERYGRRGNGKSSWSSPSRAPGRRETTTKSTFGGAAATAAGACNLSPNYFAGKSYFAAGFRNSGGGRRSEVFGNFKWGRLAFRLVHHAGTIRWDYVVSNGHNLQGSAKRWSLDCGQRQPGGGSSRNIGPTI